MAATKGRRGIEGFRDDTLNISSSSRADFLNVFDRKIHYPIFSAFCGYLSIAEIVSLTRTCKKMSDLYRYLLPKQWNVDEALRCYFDDPHGFRSQMAKCDALIFGSFAIEFFERAALNSKVMNMMIRQGVGCELLSSYLSDIAGYDFVDTWTSRDLQYHNENNMVATRMFKSNDYSKTEIHLYITRGPAIQAVLEEARSTVLGILSWNKAYSVFALPTSIQHRSYSLHTSDWLTEMQILDASHKGWQIQGVMWPEEKRRNHPIRERRRVGDKYTWTICFDTREVEWSNTPDYVLEYSGFRIDLSMSYSDWEMYHATKEDVRHYSVQVNKLESKVLKHTYTYGGVDIGEFFTRRLHSSTMLELRKLAPTQRPLNYDDLLRRRGHIDTALEGFGRPASWAYRDDEVPTWYKAFEMK